jgi:ABC-type phosphate/phosphonate transport system ATPase subunit/GNAT superfamily N-acetyltransferase
MTKSAKQRRTKNRISLGPIRKLPVTRARSEISARPLMVQSINWQTPQKLVRLSDGQILTVSVSSCIGENDEVIERDGNFFVPCANGEAKLLPLYLGSDTIRCGGLVIPLKIKEIETESEYQSFQQLSEFHYRGHRLHGRTSALIATTTFPLLPAVLGYIQLATPFFMNKCRANLIDAPFELGPIKWSQWNKTASRQYINVFVRIARTVVHPEFRGLGLGQLLVSHALQFAEHHWHVANLKPLFLEIVADMLKFVPFPERAGLHFIGVTEGNLHRVRKDMAYLIGQRKKVHAGEVAREDSVGVVDLQVSYMNKALGLMKHLHLAKNELNTKLEHLIENMTLEDYEQLQSILRLPKPTYMRGIFPESEHFVLERLNNVQPIQPKPLELVPLRPIGNSIILSRLSVHYTSFVTRTKKTQTVQKAFGVAPGSIKATVVKDLDLTVKPKEIVLIAGASGSGKTTLIELLMDRGKPRDNMVVEGNCFLSRDVTVGILEPVRSKLPVIQLVGGNDTHRALHVLNIAGLTEAFLYFKRFDQLSSGQKYRLMLARLIDSGANLWIADEFCSTLDEITASIVAHNLQRHARRMGATVVVAAPHYATFIRSLRPDKVLKLSSAWEWESYSGQQFISLAAQSALQEKMHGIAAAS